MSTPRARMTRLSVSVTKRYAVVAPFFVRDDAGRPTELLGAMRLPPRAVGYYTFDQARALLRDISRHRHGDADPSGRVLEPYAVEVLPCGADGVRTHAGRLFDRAPGPSKETDCE